MLVGALKVNRYTFRGSNYDIFNFPLSLISNWVNSERKEFAPLGANSFL